MRPGIVSRFVAVVVTLVVVTLVVVTLVVVTLVVLRFFFCGTARGQLAAGGHPTAARLGSSSARAGPCATRLRLACPEIGQLSRREPADDDRDVACALADAARAAAGPGAEPLHRGALVGVARRHEEFLCGDVVVVLCVGHGRIEALANDDRNGAVGELEDLAGLAVRLVADQVEHLTRLVGRDVRVLYRRPRTWTLVGLVTKSH